MCTAPSQFGLYMLDVGDMSCQHCVQAVTRTLSAIPGVSVRTVAIGTAEIVAPDEESVATAVAALDEAGYPARVRAPTPRSDERRMGTCGCTAADRPRKGQGRCG